MFEKKKESEYVFDRSQFDADELSEIDRIKNMLDAAEVIKMVARQSKFMPGGKLITPRTVFATNKRILIKDPNTLGLRADIDSIPYSQINNVKLKKGAFTSEITIESGQFKDDNQGFIPAIPKEKAAKIIGIINEYVRQAQHHPVFVENEKKDNSDDPMTILKKRFAKGEITKEEFEDMKKTLE